MNLWCRLFWHKRRIITIHIGDGIMLTRTSCERKGCEFAESKRRPFHRWLSERPFRIL
jgi:hypothetical protein